MREFSFIIEPLSFFRISVNALNKSRVSNHLQNSTVIGIIENAFGYQYYQQNSLIREAIKEIEIKIIGDANAVFDVQTIKRGVRKADIINSDGSLKEKVFTNCNSNMSKPQLLKKLIDNFKEQKLLTQNAVSNYFSFKYHKLENEEDIKRVFGYSKKFYKNFINSTYEESLKVFTNFINSKVGSFYNSNFIVEHLRGVKYEVTLKLNENILKASELKKALLNPKRPLGIGKKRVAIDIQFKELI